MPLLLSKSSARKILPAFALVAVAATIGLTIKARSGAPTSAAQGRQQGERIEVEYVMLTRAGFEPAEITRPQGRFVLAVSNRTGLEGVEVRLEREAGGRLHEVRLPRRKRDWSERVELPPGRYLLTEASHPEWKCLVTITPRGN